MRLGCITVLLLLTAAGVAKAEDVPEWRDIIVRFTIDDDGKLHVTEQVQVDVPPSAATLERIYRGDAEQQVEITAITLYGERTVKLERGNLDEAHEYQMPHNGWIQWSVRDKNAIPDGVRSYTYVIETTIADGVIPAWSIPRGELGTRSIDDVGDPRERIREVLPVWREARKNPRRRFLLDYQFEMPPPSAEGTTIQLQLYWGDKWAPVRTITPDTIARRIERDFYHPTRWRVTHLFDYSGPYDWPVSVDVPRHAIRMGALIGFGVLALLLWILFVMREVLRRVLGSGARDPRAPEGARDAHTTPEPVETVLSEAPEIIAARWSGDAQFPSIEEFLRRLERERKLTLVIEPRAKAAGDEDEEDDEPVVSIRLLVPREHLSAYERAGIDALIPEGWETSTDDIRRRHSGHDFDPTEALYAELAKVTERAKKSVTSPWYSRLTSFLLFAAGVVILLQETVRLGREPAILAAALISASLLNSLWPRNLARRAIRNSLLATLLLWIPLLLAWAVVVSVHFAASVPPGMYGSVGLGLILLGAYKALLAGSATRDANDFAQLVRARRWLRNELKSDTPRLRDEWIPWMLALGLGSDIARWRQRHQSAETRFASSSHWTGNPPGAESEDWGGALMSWTA